MQLRLLRIVLPALIGVLALAGSALAQKEKGPKDKKDGAVLARILSPFDTLWSIPEKGDPRPLALYAEVGEGRLLTPPGQRGVLGVKEGDLRLTLIGALPELTHTPALEAVVRLRPSKAHDLDVELERGILLLEAGKDSPGGKALVRIQDKTIEVGLHKDSAVALELFSWWPAGTRFPAKEKVERRPVTELWLFVLRGQVDAAMEGEKQLLTAPLVWHWDSLGGARGPLALKKIPAWVDLGTIKDKEMLALLIGGERIRLRSEKNPKAWSDALRSIYIAERIAAVNRAFAFDRPAEVVGVLNEDKSPLVRDAAVAALRHFAGRGEPQVKELFQALADAKFKPGQAAIVLNLLHGFTSEEINRPETYESLIGYLGHEQQAIRHLAGGQLAVLAPAGKDIAFDAAADPEARSKAQAVWRELIPAGSLPKAEKKAEKK